MFHERPGGVYVIDLGRPYRGRMLGAKWRFVASCSRKAVLELIYDFRVYVNCP